ncbi:MAG: RtcB family protein [Spirochaetales bacterium]|nr:RtcB family protein [Spirochaetales bacterium]
MNLASLPFVFHHLAFMPDLHGGMGMPIGGILATKNVIIPNAVGVDIGCGMCAVKTNMKLSEIGTDVLKKKIMSGIRSRIPVGFDHHKDLQDEAYLPQGHDVDKLTVVKAQYIAARHQIGTLGGGNHFIELQKDGEDNLWIMLHSGSRNLGYKVAEYYNKIAREVNAQNYSVVQPELQLAFIPHKTPLFGAYWSEMKYCVDFAFCNRSLMMQRIQEVISDTLPGVVFEPMINIAHNYVAIEHHFGENVFVHRKGAVRARAGEIGIIPGSQGTKSYIVEGLGNPDSFESSSHGAGRVMSRTAAINELSLEDEVARLDAQGIVHAIRCQKDLEEAPGAYKDIDEVMANQKDLVKVVTSLSPVAVVKGL